MPFNLIADRWLPCRRATGARAYFAPNEITDGFADDPIVALDFPRPDWNAAVLELLIGLLSTAMPPADADTWAERWLEPPSPAELSAALAPLTFAFDLDGDGPRCFQDLTVLQEEGKVESVENLLMNAPADDNRDLFVKAEAINALSRPFAAAALVTLQTYAPGGGRGHMANPRKKGPLSSRLTLGRQINGGSLTSLWDQIWPNVLPSSDDDPLDGETIRRHLPWFEKPTSETGGVMTGEGKPGWALYFSQPRRLVLEWSDTGACHFAGQGSVCTQYRTRPKGHQYEAWRHPLSSYRVTEDGEWKCIPTPQIRSYEDWPAIWSIKDGHHPPLALAYWRDRLIARRSASVDRGIEPAPITRHRGLSISGIVADRKLEAKVLGWLDERIPYFEPPPDALGNWNLTFQQTVGQLVAGAREAANALQYALRLARFGKRDGDGFKLLANAPKDAFDEFAALLWRETEAAFVAALEVLHTGDVADIQKSVRRNFLDARPDRRDGLRPTATRLFDAAANIDSLADQDAKRLVLARKGLVIALSEQGAVAQALGLAAHKSKKGKSS